MLACGGVPDLYEIPVARCESLAIRAKLDANLCCVPSEFLHLLSCGHVPQLQGAVMARSGESLAIRAKLYTQNRIAMAFQARRPLARGQVPYRYDPSSTRGGKVIALGAPRYAGPASSNTARKGSFLVALERLHPEA